MRICVLPGDGIGPEVTRAALRVLDSGGVALRLSPSSWTSARSAAPRSMPRAIRSRTHTREACLGADAVLLGAVGGPSWNGAPIRPEQGLLALRSVLGCYANLRPARRYTRHTTSPLRDELVAGLDLVIVRELIGGIYFGDRGLGDEAAYDTCNYSAFEIRRDRGACLRARRSPQRPGHERRQGQRARHLEALAARRRARSPSEHPGVDARASARRLDGDVARRAPRRLRRDRDREPLRGRPLRPRRRRQRRHRPRALGVAGRRRAGHLRADPRLGARHRRASARPTPRARSSRSRCCSTSSASRPPRAPSSAPSRACSTTAPARPTWAAARPPTRSAAEIADALAVSSSIAT